MEELRTFWKERALIEDDYAKRLAKLAKFNLGKDEIGELRNSLDIIRLETDKQAGFHQTLATQIKTDLEAQSAAFLARQAHFKKKYQSAVEKEFKTKNTQESFVNQAREKYEADCVRINSYTAQSTLMQGKDLERISTKLERAQKTVQANEKDYANFCKALQDTVQKWEQDWKVFCDSAQDMEEERLDFMKDNMWAYANAVSTVCVADDESCEKIRVALEQFEPDKDMENFVRDYGTGNAVPDPPTFVNYANPNAVPASSSRPTSRPANFARQTTRTASRQASIPPPEEEPPAPAVNMAGVGSAGLARAVSQSRANVSRGASQINANINGNHPGPASPPVPSPYGPGPATELVIGDQAYQVDPTNDPQTTRPQTSSAGSNVGKDDDPLARQMNDLRNGSVRRNSFMQKNEPSHVRKDSALSPPAESSSTKKDYRNSAEMVVGSYPITTSRPVSPSQPTAAMMRPHQSPSGTGLSVEGVLANYPQKLPEERTHSRSNSRQSQTGGSQGGQNRNLERPVSREGFAGIGSQGRSPSPGFSPSRGTSPVPPRQGSVSRVPAPSANDPSNSVPVPATNGANRATTPNSVGIALDLSGKVAVDTLADTYAQQPHQAHQPQPVPSQPPQQYHQPPAQAQPGFNNRRMSIGNGNAMGSQQVMHLPPQQQPPYGAPPPAPYGNPPYMPPQQQPPPIGYANVPPPQHYPPPQLDYQQPQHPYAAQNQGSLTRGQSVSNGGYYPGPPQQQNQYGRPPSPQQMHNQPVPAASSNVSAAPTGQYTENGTPVLFYVKALYDYTASIEEEFDFQSGDIIAVTSTPEDGWWSGELLDEARRQHGRHVFPSNFVCLF